MHVHYESIRGVKTIILLALDLRQQLELVHHRCNALLSHYSGLRHLLHCVDLFLFFLFHFPDLAETAATNRVLELELRLRHS